MLLLIVLGMGLLILEIKVTSYGLLTIGGAASLIFGSMILVDSSAPELQLNLRLILPVVAGIVAIAVLLVRLAVSAQRLRPTTGEEGMIGAAGVALTSLEPGSARAASPPVARSGRPFPTNPSPRARRCASSPSMD